MDRNFGFKVWIGLCSLGIRTWSELKEDFAGKENKQTLTPRN